MFVPADSERKLVKALQINADAVILDWEDAVRADKKEVARRQTKDLLLEKDSIKPAIFIRCNPVSTPDFSEDAMVLKELTPRGVVISKCQSSADVHRLDTVLNETDSAQKIRLYPLIESPTGILNALSIVNSSSRISGLAFGAEDFALEMGITTTSGEIELLYARSALVITCRAAGLEALDSPCLALHDLDNLKAHILRSRNLGFTGKLSIHPSQVPLINELLYPDESEIKQARKILSAYAEEDSGATIVDGTMVDMAVVRRAKRILEMLDGGERN